LILVWSLTNSMPLITCCFQETRNAASEEAVEG
jgi:hypothetical protein